MSFSEHDSQGVCPRQGLPPESILQPRVAEHIWFYEGLPRGALPLFSRFWTMFWALNMQGLRAPHRQTANRKDRARSHSERGERVGAVGGRASSLFVIRSSHCG